MTKRCPRLNDLPPPPPGKTGWPWTEESPSLPDTMPDGTPWPKISLVTPSYNQGQFVEETLRSVLLQGYPNLEYIVIDGGSTDESVGIIEKYAPWLTYWESEPDRGQAHAINKGLSHASGNVFGWMCSDDFYLPNALKRLMLLRSQHPNAALWAMGCDEVSADGSFIRHLEARVGDRAHIGDWWYGAFFHQPACLFSADYFREVGGVNENFEFALDVDLWIRLRDHAPFATRPETVACARSHQSAKTILHRLDSYLEVIYSNYLNDQPKVAKRRFKRHLREGTSLTYREVLSLFWQRTRRGILRRVYRSS